MTPKLTHKERAENILNTILRQEIFLTGISTLDTLTEAFTQVENEALEDATKAIRALKKEQVNL